MKNTEKFIFDKFSLRDIFYADYLDRLSLYELFSKKINHYIKGKVLDFGCGRKPYEVIFDCKEYIGIDTYNSGHAFENSVGPDIFYDGEKLPFEDECFDTVFSSQVFEHVKNLDFSMLEIRRVLKKGGRLVVTMPMAEEEHEIPYDFRRFTQYGIEAFFEKNGFRILESGKVNNWKNSMRIIKIAQVCHSQKNNFIMRIYKYVVIAWCNISRRVCGNRILQGDEGIFSNKVYCIGEKLL